MEKGHWLGLGLGSSQEVVHQREKCERPNETSQASSRACPEMGRKKCARHPPCLFGQTGSQPSEIVQQRGQ